MARPNSNSPDRNLQEINRYNDAAFPIGIYTVTPEGIVPEGRGYRDLHWHEELQLTRVEAGTLEIRVDGTDYTLHQGDAILINRNLLHITTKLSSGGKYISLNFPDRLLGFFPGSRMEQDYVFPYTRTYLFSAVVLHSDEPWQWEILNLLAEILAVFGVAAETAENAHPSSAESQPQPLCPEYQIAARLTALWSILIQNIASDLTTPSRTYLRKQERIHTMLSYIHENYTQEVRLADVAEAAHISVGECCRCFRSMVHTSPNQYLLEYRISKSKELLLGTDLSVTDVGYAVGFNDTSYFIHYFRKVTGVTPKEYVERAR
jgi:AraC family transcriptional regulator, melibiose operon regulatory protein